MTKHRGACLVGLGALGLVVRLYWRLPTSGEPTEAEYAAKWKSGSGSLGTDEDAARWVKASMNRDLPRRRLAA